MLAVISPAKKLDDCPAIKTVGHTMPEMLEDAQQLADIMKKKSVADIRKLMGVSESIAQLNVNRYRQYHQPFTEENARQALLMFKGDVYQNIHTVKFSQEDFAYTQKHLRILSGLYGLLRPLDMIQPYRLEMGTRLKNPRGKDLYTFWGSKIAEKLNEALKEQGDDVLVNVASSEYFKAVDKDALKGRIIHVHFKEHRNGEYKTLGMLAKRARGMMVDWMVHERPQKPDELKQFDREGYLFAPSLSDAEDIIFTRD